MNISTSGIQQCGQIWQETSVFFKYWEISFKYLENNVAIWSHLLSIKETFK